MEKLLRKKKVLELCGVSNATLYRMIKAGVFPEPLSLTGERSVAWKESEVELWMGSLKRVPLAKRGEYEEF